MISVRFFPDVTSNMLSPKKIHIKRAIKETSVLYRPGFWSCLFFLSKCHKKLIPTDENYTHQDNKSSHFKSVLVWMGKKWTNNNYSHLKILDLTFVLVKAKCQSCFLANQTENLPAALLKNVVWLHHTSRCQSTHKQLLTKHYKWK